MLFERIESPVPDWTRTPAATLNAIVLPWPPAVPPIVLFDALVLKMMPLISLPSGSVPVDVGADVVPLDEIARRGRTVDAGFPTDWPRSRCGPPRSCLPTVLSDGSLDQDAFVRVASVGRARLVGRR